MRKVDFSFYFGGNVYLCTAKKKNHFFVEMNLIIKS